LEKLAPAFSNHWKSLTRRAVRFISCGMKTGFRLLALAALCAVVLSSSVSSRAETITDALKPYVEKHALAGAVALVATSNKILEVEAVGWADIAANKAMKTDCEFWIASQSKAMTAAAVMMLVDEDKIGLDDPVQKFLPEFNDMWVASESDKEHVLLKRPQHPITIRKLLSHTSGLPFKSRMEEPTLDGLPLRDAVRSYAMTPLDSEPGTKYKYSNAGINTAARVVEVVGGMPYEDFMQKRLFDPLGMTDTTFWPTERQSKRIAKSYKPNAAKDNLEEIKIGQLTYPLSEHSNRYPMPAGGLFSTAGDTVKFCQMLMNHGTFNGKKILSEDAVKQMTMKQTGDLVKDNYGFGLSCGEGSFGHGGAESTEMTVDIRHGIITVWMVQHAGFPLDGGKCKDIFKKAAVEKFGNATPSAK
jgi:CubicO group peptidase (beta-lactamase class C family)